MSEEMVMVPFVRQFPTRRALTEINVPASIGKIGRDFIAKNGRYLIEILPTGKVRLAACMLVKNENGADHHPYAQKDVEVIECDNDAELPSKVNLLISRSFKHVSVASETQH